MIGLLLVPVGIAALFRPALVRLNTRWMALPLLTAPIGAVGFGMLIAPGEPTPTSSPTDLMVTGSIFALIWIGLFLWCRGKDRRASVDEKSADVGSLFKKAKDAAISRWAELERLAAEKQKAQENLESIRAASLADQEKGADGRLEEDFDRVRLGELSLSDYREAVLNEQRENREARARLREDRKWMDSDEVEAEIDRLDEDREAIQWRLEWVNEKLISHQDTYGQKSGKWARFEYVDADGVCTRRNIANWTDTGRYVIGYDRSAKAERTFRVDRISDWVSG